MFQIPRLKVQQRGRWYELLRVTPYRRLDGTETVLLVWEGRCADCEAPFEVQTSTAVGTDLNRRCRLHRSPGRRAA